VTLRNADAGLVRVYEFGERRAWQGLQVPVTTVATYYTADGKVARRESWSLAPAVGSVTEVADRGACLAMDGVAREVKL
jgi:hypothetical protein